jgi:cytochrome c oxidase assembly protein subunit 15
VVVGILIAGTAILAIKNFRSEKRILFPAVLAALLVAFQGWYGSVVVSSKLLPHTVSIHLVLALTIVSLLIYVTQTVYYLGNEPQAKDHKSMQGLRISILVLWLLGIVQIVLGTQLRSEIEMILREFPLLLEREVLTVIGPINLIHGIWGILITLVSFFVAFRLVQKREETSSLARVAGGAGVLILILQVLIGSALEIFGLPPILQVFHLWTASLFIGILLVLYTELAHMKGA